MKSRYWVWAAAIHSMAVAGCVPAVMAPTVAATPGLGKSPADFAADHAACATLADQQLAPAKTAANNQIFGTALLGAAFGGGGTAAAGGSNGDVAANAAGNALSAGAATAQTAQAALQRQYDFNYSQCMYAKGEFVPGFSPPMVAEPVEPEAAPVRHRVRHAHKKPTETQASAGTAQPAPAQTAGFVEPPPVQPVKASAGFVEPAPAAH